MVIFVVAQSQAVKLVHAVYRSTPYTLGWGTCATTFHEMLKEHHNDSKLGWLPTEKKGGLGSCKTFGLKKDR